MQVYISNIGTAFIVFPAIALLITLPYMVYQYRKFGSIPWWRTLLVYLFAFYLLCAYFLVILPLPPDRTALVAYAQDPQLLPFSFILDFVAYSGFAWNDPSTWTQAFINPNCYEVVFNALMLMPLGMFLRYYFKRKWWQTLLIGFGVSLFFELSQLTGLFGLYEHPYRLFDVDDLITNTFGAMLGFWIMGPARKLLPNMTVLNQEARVQGVRVSLTRRTLSLLIDLILTGIVAWLVMAALRLIGVGIPEMNLGFESRTTLNLVAVFVYLFFLILVPVIAGGQSVGQKLLGLVIVRPDGSHAKWYQILARYGSLLLLVIVPLWFIDWLLLLDPASISQYSSLAEAINDIRLVVILIALVAVVIWFITLPLRNYRAKQEGRILVLLFELISNTRIMTVKGAHSLHDRTLTLDVAEVAALEYMIAKDGMSLRELMEHAGHSVSEAICEYSDEPVKTVIACGSGNNGGDGWVVAGDLANKGYPTLIICPKLPAQIEVEPAKSVALEVFSQAQKGNKPLRVVMAPNEEVLARELEDAEVIVDAMLGTGFAGEQVREPYVTWIDGINKQARARKNCYVVAIDSPSGLSAQTGESASPCLRADLTVTMLVYKPGLLTEGAEEYCGQIRLARLVDIGPYLERFED